MDAQTAVMQRWPFAYLTIAARPDGYLWYIIWVPTKRDDAPYQLGWGISEAAAWQRAAVDHGLTFRREVSA